MSLFGQATAATTLTSANNELKNDFEVSQPPEDSISSLTFSPVAELLAVSSWDKKVRIYEVAQNGTTQGKALYDHEGPALCTSWSKDGTKVASGGADKAGRLFDLGSGSSSQVAVHDQTIRCCEFIEVNGQQILATGSWDKTVKYWDLRQQQAVATLQLPERCYSMSVKDSLMVVATAERHICVVNLSNPAAIFKSTVSPLKFQTRVVSCFVKGNGYAVGSVEGRCAIQYVDEKDSSLNFSFKCHRVTEGLSANASNVFSVNAISFHPRHGTFSTAGSDGTFHFWDKDSKHRLKGYASVGGTIPCTAFSRTGDIFAYAVSYDWSKGHSGNTQQYPNKIMLHPVGPEELKPKAKKTTGR
ncbi:WD40-repeat-containing domain protein [Protomyces lactucae-debilis]|uniref:WD40-repeat-containing domain protein n=1 Tax=Protomyces lactucae-debilis TaxID=2754530 RepID=A0A1Y2FHF3_PROLT|nr:WD40-repeat-containing domain protein [Protomyces lactucae-debilis]ORY83027.1 WD40-repeat-containing domain protein [Protomyces lactucae-debilis]